VAGPFIDPSVMLLDPQFTDHFAVVKRVQNVDSNGLVSTADSITPNVLGIVTPTTPSDLRRFDDKQFGQRTLKIYTQARLNSAATDRATGQQRQPDYLLWNGDKFVVVDIEPWTRFGPGWTKVLATSVDSVEATT